MKKRDLYYERIPTKLLREDIRLLGTFLGRVIKDQEGISFFNTVEKLRLLSKNTLIDINKSKVFFKISKEVKKLSPKNTFKITRAFSHILNLMNLAESLDASRKLNEYENPYFKNKNQNLFIEDIIESLFKNKKISDKKIYDQATKLDIGIVLTAHPTEVKRRTLIQKYASLIKILEQRHLYKKYPSKIIELDRRLYSEIAIIWKTDECENYGWEHGIHFINEYYWEDYCRDFAEDCGYLNMNSNDISNPLESCIDWSKWADLMKISYS